MERPKLKQFSQQYTRNVTKNIDRLMKVMEMEIIKLEELLESTGDWTFMRVYFREEIQTK